MKFDNKLVLVTGGAGSIGSNLVRRLVEEKAQVIVLDDLSSGFEDNIPLSSDIQIVIGSVTDDEVLKAVFSQPIDFIFHLAASFANQKSIETPLEDLETNITGTVKLLQHSIKLKKLPRFVYASSSCVYGHSEGVIIEETALAPYTPYAISKLTAERYVRFFHNYYALPITILRYFNTYGPGERPGKYRNVIPNFFRLAMEGLPLPLTGTGKETRTFTFVSDAISATINAALVEHAIGECFNIASDNESGIKDVAQKINALAGNKAGMKMEEKRKWDLVSRRVANHKKAKRILGYEPKINLDEGLERTYEWFLELSKQGKL